MSCREIHGWTFAGLVGAFVDLAVAHLLLCAAAIAFFASKFLAFFGVDLPCPCTTTTFSADRCLRELLVHDPPSRIASVQCSARSRFPLDAVWTIDDDAGGNLGRRCFDVGLLGVGGREAQGGFLARGKEGEESRGSVHRDVLLLRGAKRESGLDGDESFSSAGGGNQRRQEVESAAGGELGGSDSGSKPLRSGFRRRRRAIGERNKASSSLYITPPLLGWQEVSQSPSSSSGCMQPRQDASDDCSTPTYFRSDQPLQCNGEFSGSNSVNLIRRAASDVMSNRKVSKGKTAGKGVVHDFERSDADTIRVLEQALEEEQSTQVALYLELEKERNAAATAADEAMAMIERLQKEKASVEMNARQYQRMIEEKAAYDEEVMAILKEIVVRRERELFFLGEECEMYRHMMLSSQMDGQDRPNVHHEMVDMSGHMLPRSLDFEDEATVMLQEICDSIKKKEKVSDKSRSAFSDPTVFEVNTGSSPYGKGLTEENYFQINQVGESSGDFHHHSPEVRVHADDDHLDFEEKGIVSVDSYTSSVQNQMDDSTSYNLNIPQDNSIKEKPSPFVDEDSVSYTRRTRFIGDNGTPEKNDGDDMQKAPESHASYIESEFTTVDVHVIGDRNTVCKDENGSISQFGGASITSQDCNLSFKPYGIRSTGLSSDHSDKSWDGGEPSVLKTCSCEVKVHQHLDGSLSRAASPFDLRRNSMSAVDSERSKLETEVEDLRRRLKVVQEGREKLNFSVGHMEKGNTQLLLLEEIAIQLREIRQMKEPEKVMRQASLPPPSSKVNSKKRRCRSASLGVQGST